MCTSGLLTTLSAATPCSPYGDSLCFGSRFTGLLCTGGPVNRDHLEVTLLFCTAYALVVDDQWVPLGIVIRMWKQHCLPVEPIILEN